MPINVRLVDHTKNAVDAKDEAIKRALEIIGAKMEGYAKALCPVGTPKSTGIEGYMGGTLRNSITYVTAVHSGETREFSEGDKFDPKTDPHGGKSATASTDEEEVVYVGTNVYYAPYVEYGYTTRGGKKKAPKRFLRNALKNHMSEYEGILRNEIKKADKF